MPDPLEDAVSETIGQVDGLKNDLQRLHALLRFVTKHDVEQMEERLLLAIRQSSETSNEDDRLLDKALRRSERMAKRLERLDSRYPTQPKE